MFAMCIDLPGVTEATARRVEEEIGGGTLEGLVAHVAGPYDGGWRIVDVWDSYEAQQRFEREVLGPARQRALGGLADAPPPGYEARAVTGVLSLV